VNRHIIDLDSDEEIVDDSGAFIKKDETLGNEPDFSLDELREHYDEHDDYAEEFYKYFDDLKNSDNLNILIYPKLA